MIELLQAELSVLSNFFDYGLAGAVIAVSILGNVLQYRRNQKLQDMEREAMIKVTELVTKTLSALQENVEVRDKIGEMIFILNETKEHWKGLPDIRSKIEALINILEYKK